MANTTNKFINQQLRWGMALLAAGLVIGLFGIALPGLVGDLPFNERIITGLGILLIGGGIAYLVRYQAARKDSQEARRMVIEASDERMQSIRARAGNRAFWVSAGLGYAGLMWLSFAASGSLPVPSADAQWYFMAGLVIVPFVVYFISMAYDQQHH